MAKPTPPKIAILGWGSLIWDVRPEFDDWHEPWQDDGPVLPLEFSRVSKSRKGALTLVIDDQSGADCVVQFALSKRRSPDDAIADLRCREGTNMNRIGFWFADNSRKCAASLPKTIAPWASEGTVKDLSHIRLRDGGSLGLIREKRAHVDVLPG